MNEPMFKTGDIIRVTGPDIYGSDRYVGVTATINTYTDANGSFSLVVFDSGPPCFLGAFPPASLAAEDGQK